MSQISTPEISVTSSNPELFTSFISRHEVARRLGKSVSHIDRLRRTRKLPYYKVGGAILFRWPEVEKALERFRVKEVTL